jgi:hypothetical protein
MTQNKRHVQSYQTDTLYSLFSNRNMLHGERGEVVSTQKHGAIDVESLNYKKIITPLKNTFPIATHSLSLIVFNR